MITPMKKYSFLVFHSDYHQFVSELGKMGVLHVAEIEKDEDVNLDSIAGLTSRLQELQQIYKQLKEIGDNRELHHEAISVELFVQEYWSIQNRLKELNISRAEIEKEIGRIEPWGKFSHQDIEWFGKAGYHINLFSVQLQGFDPHWEERYSLFEIHRSRTTVYFVVIAPGHIQVEIDAELHGPDIRTIDDLNEELEVINTEQSALSSSLAFLARGSGIMLEGRMRSIESELALKKVYLNTTKESGDSIHILEGWAPGELEKEIYNLAETHEAVCVSRQAEHGENAPVQLKNSYFSRLFEPITRLI